MATHPTAQKLAERSLEFLREIQNLCVNTSPVRRAFYLLTSKKQYARPSARGTSEP